MTGDQGPFVLVVDDEEPNLDLVVRLFDDDFRLLTAKNADLAVKELESAEVAVLVTDQRMPGRSGVDLLAEAAKRWPDVRRILLTAYSDRELLLDAIKRGHVDEYVLKPWDADDLRLRIEGGLAAYARAKDLARAAKESVLLRAELEERTGSATIVGLDGGGLAAIAGAIAKLATSDAPVVLRGETGTGKELIARAIHKRSRRASGPFVRVGCRATSGDELARTLFSPEGRLAQAASGTLFLDEVADLPLPLQALLLEALEDPRVRVIAATREAIEERTKQGTFREDLFFRLNVVPLVIPPLRARKDDVEALANHFAQTIGSSIGKTITLSREAVLGLVAYDWPGNVRELRNVVERACILAEHGTMLEREDLMFDFSAPAPAASLFDEISAEEAQRVREALKAAAGNRARAARALGIPRTTLNDRIKRLGIA
jgi:DNA-binding NtrC family response regulator